MSVRDVLAALQAKRITPAEAKETIAALKRSPAEPVPEKSAPIAEAVDLRIELGASLAEALYVGVHDLDLTRPFSELGLDSIIGVEWVRVLNKRYGVNISATKLYDYTTVQSLADYLEGELGVRQAEPAPVVPREPLSPAEEPLGNELATSPAEARDAAAIVAPEMEPASQEAIAIIGMAGEFPKARNLAEFWDNLANGRDCISEVPENRWSIARYYDPNPDAAGKSYSKWMGVVEDADRFDPLFFNLSPAEAEWMDPQQRLFLRASWQCIEDAGVDPTTLSGSRCGVFVGCAPGDYGASFGDGGLTPEGLMGLSLSILSARIAYFLNLKGPCLAIETSCSSSLVAIAQACDSLMLGQSDVALAGGVCVLVGPRMHIMTSKAGMLSRDGRCFTFDDRADGFVPGEGVGVVLLKRLSDAVRDGDRIDGVLRGWGLNQDGRTNGITAPSARAQTLLETDVYARFGIDPATIGLVETHGTATKLGDPIEIEALTEAFRASTDKTGYCAVGSVKSNIGHLLAAAGVAGVIKVLLALRHRTLPPTVGFRKLNEHISLESSPFYINTERRPWETAPGSPRRAAISSFGFSGTNAHLVIEEYIGMSVSDSVVSRESAIVVLSARNQERLQEQAWQLLHAIQSGSYTDRDLPNIAYTLQVGREAMEARVAMTVSSLPDLADKLRCFVEGQEEIEGLHRGEAKRRKEALSLFADGEEIAKTVEVWIGTGNHIPLMKAWVLGVAVDWNRLHRIKPMRLSLPTYPFARERYWVPVQESSIPQAHIETVAEPPETAKLMTFEEVLEERAVGRASSEARTIVCLATGEEQRSLLANALGPQIQVVFIEREESLRDVAALHGRVDGLLYLADGDRLRDCAAILRLVQALAASRLQCPRLWLAGECDTPLQRCHVESWLGFERSLKFVLPQTRVAVLAVEKGDALSGALSHEIASESIESAVYESGRRYAWRVRTRTLDAGNPVLRAGGTYLITGGAGELGWLFAQHLAKRYAAKLILTGRSPLTEAQQSRVRTLEHALYLQGDVCDIPRMSEIVQQARAQFGPIHGVIHAAGIVDVRSVLDKDAIAFARVMAPKIDGAMALDEALRGEQELDFLCSFSSSAAILGDVGWCDYSIANRFQMAYARHAAHKSAARHLAIAWPLWQHGGMDFDKDDSRRLYLETSGQSLLETEQGLAVFEQLLGQDGRAPLVMVGQPGKVHRFLGIHEASVGHTGLDVSDTVSHGPGRRSEMKGWTLEQCVIWDVKEHAGALMKISRAKLDTDANLADFGFDSIRLATFARDLGRHYSVEITPAVFFSYPTLGKLAEYLLQERRAEMETFYRTESAPAAAAVRMVEPRRANPVLVHAPADVAEPIAIIGMSGRFPQARNVDELWRILAEGRDVVEEIPAERFDWRKYYGDPRNDPSKTNCRWSGFIPGVDEFDPLFFEIAPLEAETMDPRQRLLLQEAWNALEDAGYGSTHIHSRRIGMFVGVEQGDYQSLVGARGGPGSNHDAILAARLSYFLNLRGPAMAINTACSSGLVATHQACMSLRAGECDTAIAAGVNVLLTPTGYLVMSQAGMLSSDGKCYAFDQRANGMVPGEAVVAVVLKCLSQAESDGDPIHAVIRGSGINYDGKTNGITAPSGASQASLLREVHRRAHVSPRQIDYVVTHGTGTQLGDPVEINALYDAFKGSTSDQGFCALTSTKSNLGHTFAASGLVSLVSLVQAMRHEMIPASLHCEKENDYIVWESSPFYVNKASRDWPRNPAKPRLGAVSAFGMSGTNAHVVVESYERQECEDGQPVAPSFLLPLSAKTEEALSEKVQDLLAVLRERAWPARSLQAMSHTLSSGRQHFEHRLAVVASDCENAVHLLQHVGGSERLPNGFTGRVDREFKGQSVIASYAEELLSRMPALQSEPLRYQETLAALADFYCQGYELPWEKLYGEAKPKRVALPTYPFAKERYWVTSPALADRAAVLHPLVQQNTSDLSEQRFTSIFTGAEAFLAEHVVQGSRVMPGVAYLEMARAAVGLAMEIGESQSIRLENVVFARPLVVHEPQTVHITLSPEEAGQVAYDIYSTRGDESPTHSQGVAIVGPKPEVPPLDLTALRALCEEGPSAAQCYEKFRDIGLDYGAAHRGLQKLAIGRDDRGLRFVVADVALPEADRAYGMHPCLMDSALQGSIALIEADGKPLLPFAVDALEIVSACPSTAVAVIREAAVSTENVRKLDVDICDPQGLVCVRLHGFSVRVLDGDVAVKHANDVLPAVVAEAVGDEENAPIAALEARTVHYLKRVVARTLKLEMRRIEESVPFEKYGIDSILVMQLTNELEKTFGSLSKTLFFEYLSIRAMAGYFLAEHRPRLSQLLGIDEMPAAPQAQSNVPFSSPQSGMVARARFGRAPNAARPARWQDIAIIGVSGRYPQAANLELFWENLRAGRDSITEIPKERWDHGLYFDPEKGKPGKSFSKWGGFLDDVDRFDPLFFNISPREAEMMDPQERLFLECVYGTLEDAGYTREALARCNSLGLEGNVGVFVGVMYEEYQLFGAQAQTLGKPLAFFGSPSSIANRISYFCNFHGPSMAVDTMCSSSLTAIHLACHSLQRGDCEAAIAGGVNVSIHPNKYLTLSQGQFASSKGRCESFGEGGDGYVPGEGVGAVLLKPLAKAIEDGDRVHAVIKASAVNHGGKTNGYSVPNPNAQANVVSRALKESALPVRAISYIEAHGTGTSLGDPIEIAALTKAFAESTSDRQFCAIGSAKSNIGHCESAAGIAGVSKVLLQMRHGMLVPSLHSETLNPHIDFAAGPFVVQQELQEWKRPVFAIGGQEREYPRIAGVSSFGAGGSNAHLVIEEPVAPIRPAVAVTPQRPAIVVLSARTKAQLTAQVRNLLHAIEANGFRDAELADIAYTLQIGREAMEHRLALAVVSLSGLEEKLRCVLEGEEGIEDVHRGTVRRNEETLSVFMADEDMQKAIEAWVAKGKYDKLLDLWAKGLVFDWSKLHGEAKPRRISLPTYPFARERYWAPLPELLTAGSAGPLAGAALHPLVQQNTSDLSEQRFTSTFTGDEPHLADHVIHGTPTLPAAAYLEMMRAAVAMAAGEANSGIRLENVAFARPAVVGDEPLSIHIALQAEEAGEIACEVYSQGDDGHEVVHCQGHASLLSAPKPASTIDVAAFQRDCTRTLSAAQCYETFRSLGLHYGSSHRALESVQSGDGFALAKYALPAAAADPYAGTNRAYVLHPSVIDAALQASIGLVREPGTAYVPFAVDRVEIFGPCAAEGYAYLRGGAQKLDIDVVDAEGRVSVSMKGLSLRAVAAASEDVATLLFQPEWYSPPVRPATDEIAYSQRWLVLASCYESCLAELKARLADVQTLLLGSSPSDAIVETFELVQQILRDKPRAEVLVQVVVPMGAEQAIASALSGLLKTAHLENPKIVSRVIAMEAGESADVLFRRIEESHRSGPEPEVRYQHGERQVVRWVELTSEAEWKPWRDGGVYVISGGASGVGLLFAREIAAQVRNARLILTGRSERDLDALRIEGALVEYHQVDVSDGASVVRLLQDVHARFGAVHGVIHSAGVIRDAFLVKKERDEVESVLAPKVAGVIHLDEASREFHLDFFAVFSSLSGVTGNVGQADYASANAFLDGYAHDRNRRVSLGECYGRTLSIDWPLWREGGMRVDAATLERIRTRLGLAALDTDKGMRAFYRALAAQQSQIAVVAGDPVRARALLQPPAEKVAEKVVESAPSVESDRSELRSRTVHYLTKLLADALKLDMERIEADALLERYGIDSVLVMQLTNELEKSLGSLSKTLFFEYQTLDALAGHLVRNHRERLAQLLDVRNAAVTAPSPQPAMADVRLRRRPRFASTLGAARSEARQDIAIIGLSGRYPQAPDVATFWENLKAGRDCITEIPAERWDSSRYFDAEKGKFGKSYSKWGGFIDGVDRFDPLFFNISPREAAVMDPQERLFLQCVYEAIEDAGYTREALGRHQSLGLEGNVGVFVGVMYEEYQLFGAQAQTLGKPFALPGNPSFIANRVSYFCNFHGPSIALDTMCSSSLTALHLACQSLQRGGCEVAVAGGVNVSIHPNKYLGLAQGQFVSSEGRCESFGEGGDGYVPGEGVGAVLLKPLAKAIADGDQIYGVIKATAINHGGKTNGFSVPNPHAQANVIAQALKESGVPARAISYIEAHGTGTKLGDPIEISALSGAFSAFTQDKQFCAIGSAKSNIGHCESAAGIAGLTKVLLQMKHKMLAPSLHAETLNPHIDFANSPFIVQRELAEWQRPVIDGREHPRIAGLSSFGAGGSNAHVVIEEHVAPLTASIAVSQAIVVLSAKSEEQLRQQAQRLMQSMDVNGFTDADLANIAYTLQLGREAMEYRLALTAKSVADLRQKLGRFVDGESGIEGLYRGEVKRNKEALSVFTADEELQEAIGKWIERGKYAKLLNVWVKGLAFDWSRLYGQQQPRRISLPTYPFAYDRHWIDIDGLNEPVAVTAPPPQEAEKSVRREERFVAKQWELCEAAPVAASPRGVIIVATPETSGLAAQLAQRFPGSRVIHAGEPLTDVHYQGWIDLVDCGNSSVDSLDWIRTLQHWLENGPKQGRMALCVTRALESLGNTSMNLAAAPRAALYRMLQSEYASVRSRHMDVEAVDDALLIEQIVSEFFAGSDDVEVCYRGGQRHRAVLREVDVPADRFGGEPAIGFQRDEVLWITGGTRGIGSLCARHFAQNHGVRRIVLHGRETLPPREQWVDSLQRDDSIGHKIRSILALEESGVEVRVSSVSLTDEQALREELADVKQSWGAVGGLLHCAGLMDLDTPPFIRKTVAGMQSVLAPKVTGLDNLIRCFQGEPLRCFVLFSSVSAVIPSLAVGQSDYAMANAYMDYAAEANMHSLPIVSIQWPSWKESGIGEAKGRAYQQTGLLSHTDAEGLRLLDRVLAGRRTGVVLPAIVNADLWRPEQLMQRAVAPSAARANESASATREWLMSLVAERLNLDLSKLDGDTPLQDYGVDSVMLAQLLAPVSERVGEKLDPSILFEYPTIESFAAWLTSRYAGAFAEASVPHAQPSRIEVRPAGMARNANAADVAVVGMACRFPGANGLEEYWNLLAEGRSAIRALPERRFGRGNGHYAGLLENVTHFAPAFFQIPQSTAAAMDPQALLVLEATLEACAHAGYSLPEIKGAPIGVYLGARSQHRPDDATLYDAQDPIVAVGQNYLASNISRFFDLRGPSLVVDTACSSALVAMNLAMQALACGDITAALVGGVSLLEGESALRMFEQRGILHPEPRFHMFDRRARGTVLGEGVGMVMLKTLDQARSDGDRILAVVKSISINNDGRTAGPTSPNLQARKEVMQAALARSGKRAEDVSYVDVNGSGSEVTDLLELKAIEAVYRSSSTTRCVLGSMKPNIGHPLCAEGIASLIKVVLMLHHRQWVPFLSAEEPMAHYDLASSPFHFSRALAPWNDAPRVAAVNCFADGGTNAHVILEAWEAEQGRRSPIAPPALDRIPIHAHKAPLPTASASFWKRPARATIDPASSN